MSYGTPPPPPPQYGAPTPPGGAQPQGTSVLAIISLVSGIVSVLCCSIFVFNIVAVVTGLLALKEINRGEKTGKGMAMTGLILGAVFLLFAVIYWVLVASGVIPSQFEYSSGNIN
ncbi:DUF4190 domain-containing protein [Nocardioides sp. KC13]|uniref:DUF4190 domain-containing protein n=1 Tax=Nocardioides turkmenicus TaxID=2711220 RepID=A0A6M1QYC6_9ACTN|nr:DUF4190 domain-containing protein [Nocardioides sp. KC13]NGN91441.1 DUF4190 domain-containing protein [Nocardioides sp. KC13]